MLNLCEMADIGSDENLLRDANHLKLKKEGKEHFKQQITNYQQTTTLTT